MKTIGHVLCQGKHFFLNSGMITCSEGHFFFLFYWPWTSPTNATVRWANVCLEYSSPSKYHFPPFQQFAPNCSIKCLIIDVALSSSIMIDLMSHCFVTKLVAVNQRHLQKPVINTENNLCRQRTIWCTPCFEWWDLWLFKNH